MYKNQLEDMLKPLQSLRYTVVVLIMSTYSLVLPPVGIDLNFLLECRLDLLNSNALRMGREKLYRLQ